MRPRAGIVTTNRAVFEDVRETLGRLGVAHLVPWTPEEALAAPPGLLWIVDMRLPGALQLVKKLLAAAHVHGLVLSSPSDRDLNRHLCLLGVPALVLHREIEPPPDRDHTLSLSRREIEILTLVSWGMSNGEIGAELGISALTVKSHMGRMFSRTGAKDRAHLVLLAMRDGIIT